MEPTEKEITQAIRKISQRLASKFKFGYFTDEDIEQEVAIICIEAVKSYDGKRPLENYLWSCTKNRLCNLKRNKYERLDKPCLKCPLYDPKKLCSTSECSEYEEKTDCKIYRDWLTRNSCKKTLMNSSGIEGEGNNPAETEEQNYEKLDREAIEDLIDRELPATMREDYVRFKFGLRINRIKSELIFAEIKAICIRNGVIEE